MSTFAGQSAARPGGRLAAGRPVQIVAGQFESESLVPVRCLIVLALLAAAQPAAADAPNGVKVVQEPDKVIVRKRTRSEEHTSELQSPCNLVCRLLLEKKKKS